jgi:hypothetical protein
MAVFWHMVAAVRSMVLFWLDQVHHYMCLLRSALVMRGARDGSLAGVL